MANFQVSTMATVLVACLLVPTEAFLGGNWGGLFGNNGNNNGNNGPPGLRGLFGLLNGNNGNNNGNGGNRGPAAPGLGDAMERVNDFVGSVGGNREGTPAVLEDALERVSEEMSNGELGEMIGGVLEQGEQALINSRTSCDSDADCSELEDTPTCRTTPRGNVCTGSPPGGMENLCKLDSDCPEGSPCFKSGGASAGYCDGCHDDEDCRDEGSVCQKPTGRPFRLAVPNGICGMCNMDGDCDLGDYCDGLDGLDVITLAQALTQMSTANLPTLECVPVRVVGQGCQRAAQCQSGACDPQSQLCVSAAAAADE